MRFARSAALAAGEPTYESGRPCKHGHAAPRFSSNGWCVECARGQSNTWHKQHPGEYRRAHPAQYKAYKEKRRAAEKAPVWASQTCIAAVYGIMRRLRQVGVDVHVDHVVPLNGKTVSGLHVRENLQIIPARDNVRKQRIFVPA
jgi:hypothetical protein